MRMLKLRGLVVYILAIFFSTFLIAPFLWLFVSSISTERELLTYPPHWIPHHPTFKGYIEVLSNPNFVRAFTNSVIISGSTVALVLLLTSTNAYCFARIKFKGKALLLTSLIIINTLPGILYAIPLYMFFRSVRLLDTYISLIAVYTAAQIPVATWVLTSFFQTIPSDLEESARVDGCTRLGAIFRIFLPVSAPGIIAVAVSVFISTWNFFIFPLILCGANTKVLTLHIAELKGDVFEQNLLALTSAGVLACLPVFFLAFALNKYIKRGLIKGGYKG